MFYTNVAISSGSILYRGIENGKRVSRRLPFRPKHYLKTEENKATHHCFDGTPLFEFEKSSIKEGKEFTKIHEDAYGMENHVFQYISDTWKGDIIFDPSKVRVYNIDIEVYSNEGFPHPEEAKHPVTSITIHNSIDNIYYVFGLGDHYKNTRSDVRVALFNDEKELLKTFLKFWGVSFPDVVTGWNIDGFDIPYLYNRLCKLFDQKTAKKLSPWGLVRDKTVTIFNKPQQRFTLVGIANLDYIDLYKKYTYGLKESYTLDHIAYEELGERKLSYEEAGSLHKLYETDFQKYLDYNIRDVELVKRIDDKNKFIGIVLTVAYYAKINYNDVASPVKTWDVIAYNYLRSIGYVVPPKKFEHKLGAIAGAWVKDPITGKHEWVMAFDLASLYPNIIRQWNMGIDTLVTDHDYDLSDVNVESLLNNEIDTEFLQEQNLTLTPNKQLFRKDVKSFFSVLMERLYIKRKAWKNQMLDAKNRLQNHDKGTNEYKRISMEVSQLNAFQMAAKILLNSGYGAMTNEYFRYYKNEVAEAITMSGQLVIKHAEQSFNGHLQQIMGDDKDRVIAADTDSNYLAMGDFVKKGIPDETDKNKIVDFLDRIGKQKLEPFISKKYQQLYDYLNCHQQLMIMDREVIADAAIWTSKKHYFMRVWDNEGVRYATPELKIMGLHAIKSSTPEICRKQMKHIFSKMLSHDEDVVIEEIDLFRQKWRSLPANEIAFPSSINDIIKYTDPSGEIPKGTPAHVRGSLIHNQQLENHDLNVEPIQAGTKIKFIYLRKPNPTFSHVISFTGFMPKEFGLDQYIDYDLMFFKAFIKPLESVLGHVNWSTKKEANFKSIL